VPDAHVTVLMPVREYQPAYLERALESILAQTSRRWQLLVIDDGADAGLGEILGGALGDDRVEVVTSESRGLAAALNSGTRHARTGFVSFLSADDMWTPDAVEVLTSFIERFPEVDLFHASRRFIDEQGRAISGVQDSRDAFAVADFESGTSPVKHPLCWRRDLALELGGFDESLDPVGVDDYDFPWSLAEAGARFMAVPECLYLLRDHREGFRLTTHVPRSVQVRALRRIMTKHGVDRAQVESHISEAKQGYLRQCLYRSRLDRWLKQLLGHDSRRGWRESYR
jgi:glycosyltransferase involved in cell wall biosynthesis